MSEASSISEGDESLRDVGGVGEVAWLASGCAEAWGWDWEAVRRGARLATIAEKLVSAGNALDAANAESF